MKAVPRKDLHQYCLAENLTTLWLFVKQHLGSRKNRVIPTLERWVPGCGPRLIVNSKPVHSPELLNPNVDMGSLPQYVQPCRKLSLEDYRQDIDIFTEFGELTPTQILTLFDQFIHWPEYKDSSFSESLESTLMKLQTNPEETVDGIEIAEEDNIDTTKDPEDVEH